MDGGQDRPAGCAQRGDQLMQTLYRNTKEEVAVGDHRWSWNGVAWNGPDFAPIASVAVDGDSLLVDGLTLYEDGVRTSGDISMMSFSTQAASPPAAPTGVAGTAITRGFSKTTTQEFIRDSMDEIQEGDYGCFWNGILWLPATSPPITILARTSSKIMGRVGDHWEVLKVQVGLRTSPWNETGMVFGGYRFDSLDAATDYYSDDEDANPAPVTTITLGFSYQIPDTPDIIPTGNPRETVKTSIAPDDSLIRRLITSACVPGLLLSQEQTAARRNTTLHSYQTSDDPWLWIVNLPSNIGTTKYVEVSGVQIRRAQSLWDFWNTSDAVWIASSIARTDTDTPASTDIYMRNLDVTDVTTYVTSSQVVVAPTTDIADDSPVWYRIPEQVNTYLLEGPRWSRIDYQDLVVTGANTAILLPFGEEITDIRLRYRSAAKTVAAEVDNAVVVDGMHYTIQRVSRWTRLDEIASYLGIERANDETSEDLQTRLEAIAPTTEQQTVDPIITIANHLGLATVYDWYPQTNTTLALPTGATFVRVIEMPELSSVSETPVKVGTSNTYVIRNKRAVEVRYNISDKGRTSSATIVDGEFELAAANPSAVIATYRARNYTLSASGGCYTQITAILENVPTGRYRVVVVSGLTMEQTNAVISADPTFLDVLSAASHQFLSKRSYWSSEGWIVDDNTSPVQDATAIRMS